MDHDELAYSRDVISPYLDVTGFPYSLSMPLRRPCGTVVGYPARGLAPFAGYPVGAIALQE